MSNFYKDGLQFSCQRCSHCCRFESGYVYLSEVDLTKLSLWFNLEKDSFIKTFCRWVPFYDGSYVLCLKEESDFDCILWTLEKGCSAYDAKPLQCSLYPFWSSVLRDSSTWQRTALDCPGINIGQFHSVDEITQKLNEYNNIIPLRRDVFYKQ